MTPATSILSMRISADLKARLDSVHLGPYRLSKTEIVERGIVLALDEIARIAGAQPSNGATP